MGKPEADSTVENREGLIRLVDAVGREHIFAPYRPDAALPDAPGLLAFVRPASSLFARLRGIISPPNWEVLYIEQAVNVAARAGSYLLQADARDLGATLIMVRWMPGSAVSDRQDIERMLIEAHDPVLNKKPVADPIAKMLSIPW
ncbi:MAG: hypothetical protein HKM95_02280 [Inquilinus sp.]|nr:hypothetical protein [Inquilinus sp.]